MKNKTVLKPCPFCGGEADILTGFTSRIKGTAYLICCLKCDTTSGFYGTKRAAKKHWNKRVGR